jgi:DNA-binding beta-propeller fold protein YncE
VSRLFVSALLFVLAVPGCDRAPHCQTFGPYEELRNHAQPFEVAVDPDRRRAYSTSLSARTLAVYDLDARTLIDAAPIGDRPLVFPDIAVDDDGTVWLASYGQPPVIRYSLDDDEPTFPVSSLALARRLQSVPGGGAVVLGNDAAGLDLLVRFDAHGDEAAVLTFERGIVGLVQLQGERVGLLRGNALDDGLEIRSLPGLELVETCDLPFTTTRGAELDDGTVLVTAGDQIGVAGCGEQPRVHWTVGVENYEVVPLGASALVLDRIGSDDPNLGLARRVDVTGVQAESAFVTAKNTGFGALDPATGLVWANSEGTSEIVLLSPDDREVVDAVRCGTHLDGIAVDWSTRGRIYLTGRLSNTVMRLDRFALEAETDEVFWPFSPAPAPLEGLLWVISQADSTVHGLDAETLDPVRQFDPGFGPNPMLTLGSLGVHPDRATLFFAQSAVDVVVELDQATGEELGRWELGGPLVADPDLVGHLQLLFDEETSAVLVCRSSDARVQRIDPGDEAVETVWLGDDVAAALAEGNAVDFATVLPLRRLLYVGGAAVDLDSLERLGERDLDVFRVVGAHPRHDGELIAVDAGRRDLLAVDDAGVITGTMTFSHQDQNASLFRTEPRLRRSLVVRSADARLCSFPVNDID